MIHPGLVSITFRQLAPAEIIEMVAQAGLEGIEWGGDIHVPHGDLTQACAVRRMTADAGLRVAAYGSYYRVGHREPVPFEAVLETAIELGAPSIRVWAGKQGSDTADDAYHKTVVQESRRIADLAQGAGLPVAYEFHRDTLTDSNAAARELLEAVAHENIRSYWQPPRGSTVDYNLAGLDAVGPWLLNVHVFNWHISTCERLPLAGGKEAWMRYLRKIASSRPDPFAMIEFVTDDAPENFSQDAATLLEWLSLIQGEK